MWQRNNNTQDRIPSTNDYSTEKDYTNTHDSQTDSGYLSGHLVSSSSLNSESDLGSNSQSYNESKNSNSSTNLHSGVDLSDRLGSLEISSSPTCTSSSSITVQSGQNEIESASKQNESRTPKVGLTLQHMSLLREIFKMDEDGDTGVHVAVSRGFVEAVYRITQLLPHQALLDLTNDRGSTPLHVAASTGNHALVRHLIACGCDPVSRDNKGDTALHIACRRGDYESVVELTRPVTVQEISHLRLLYFPSLRAGLLAADLTNYVGETCMHVAVQGGHKEILCHLAWYGADINAKEGKSGRTALHYAVESRDPSLVTFVVKNCKSNLQSETFAGLTPYQLANANGATGIAEVLLDLGAQDEPLPDNYIIEDDQDFEDMSASLGAVGLSSCIEDLKIGGISMNMMTSVPVSTCAPFNADRYF